MSKEVRRLSTASYGAQTCRGLYCIRDSPHLSLMSMATASATLPKRYCAYNSSDMDMESQAQRVRRTCSLTQLLHSPETAFGESLLTRPVPCPAEVEPFTGDSLPAGALCPKPLPACPDAVDPTYPCMGESLPTAVVVSAWVVSLPYPADPLDTPSATNKLS